MIISSKYLIKIFYRGDIRQGNLENERANLYF